MTSKPTITFETATLASSIAKAVRVAPTKGAAFDKAAGIVLTIDPKADKPVTVRATDLEITYLEWVNSLKVETEKLVLRLPAQLLHGVLSNLPPTGEVKLVDDGSHLLITSGKKRARIIKIDPSLPYMNFQPFDASGLNLVENFARRVGQVSWACADDAVPFTGVHIEGDHLIATDRYRVARVPCDVPLEKPITIPLGPLGPIMRNLTDARLAATDRRLLLMPDEYTQVTSVIFDAAYPSAAQMATVMRTEWPQTLRVAREGFAKALQAMLVLCKTERYPLVKLTIGNERILIDMDVPDVGEMSDELEVGGADHEPCELLITPTYLTEILGAVDDAEVSFSYDPDNTLALPYVTGEADDFEAWFTARRKV